MGRTIAQKQAELAQKEQRVQSILRQSTAQALAKKEASLASVDVVGQDVLLFKDNFINPFGSYKSKLKSKDADKKKREQVKHFFAKYTVCKALENVWSFSRPVVETSSGKIDLRSWYICVAQGGSLYKEHAKQYFTKKEVHHLVTCPYDLEPGKMFVYAVAKATGANEGVCSMLMNCKLSDSLALTMFNPFWQSVVRFFAQNVPKNKAELNDMIDYLDYKARQGRMVRDSNGVMQRQEFSMAGQHLPTIRIKMEEWHRELQRAKILGNHTWLGWEYPDTQYVDGPLDSRRLWTFTQITSSKELAQEGSAMRHCVLSYKSYCVSGQTSIWSLKMQHCDNEGNSFETPARKLTIEVSRSRGIVQARGLANRAPRPEEANILKRWAQDQGLTLSAYLY